MTGVSILRGSVSPGSLRQTIGGVAALVVAAILALNETNPRIG